MRVPMAEPLPSRQPYRNGASNKPRLPGRGGLTPLTGADPDAAGRPEMLGQDAFLLQDLSQLGEDGKNLVAMLGAENGGEDGHTEADELERLRAENAELRCTVAELRQQPEAGGAEGANWKDREKEYDSLLEEKSEVIRSLHLKIQELQNLAAGKAPVRLPNEDELQAVCDELERERSQLDLERREIERERAQIKDDEESLMKQMRDMEMAMSRERAELARQRNELQRLHTDIRHELELAAREASLRDRLVPLQRRHQDISNRKGAAPQTEIRKAVAPDPAPAPAPPPKKESGLFRRLFGK